MSERFSYEKRSYGSDRDKFDIQLGKANRDEDVLAQRLQNCTFELKTEQWQWEQSGNIFIEYESSGKPSGLAVTTADFWVHELQRNGQTLAYLVFPTDRLKQICRRKLNTAQHKQQAGDTRTKGIVLKLTDLLREIACA